MIAFYPMARDPWAGVVIDERGRAWEAAFILHRGVARGEKISKRGRS